MSNWESSTIEAEPDRLSGWLCIQPGHTLIDPPPAHHAELSQRALEHLQDLRKKNPAPFNQTHHHAHVIHNRPWPRQRGWLYGWWCRRRRWRGSLAPPRVEIPLLGLALGLSIVIDAATGRLSPTKALNGKPLAPPRRRRAVQ